MGNKIQNRKELHSMDYTTLLKNSGGKKSRVGIIGATRGYGYTLLAQIPKVDLKTALPYVRIKNRSGMRPGMQ